MFEPFFFRVICEFFLSILIKMSSLQKKHMIFSLFGDKVMIIFGARPSTTPKKFHIESKNSCTKKNYGTSHGLDIWKLRACEKWNWILYFNSDLMMIERECGPLRTSFHDTYTYFTCNEINKSQLLIHSNVHLVDNYPVSQRKYICKMS